MRVTEGNCPAGTKVYLDDELQKNVKEADDVEGWVDVLTLPDWRGKWVTERHHGRVRIEMPLVGPIFVCGRLSVNDVANGAFRS